MSAITAPAETLAETLPPVPPLPGRPPRRPAPLLPDLPPSPACDTELVGAGITRRPPART